MILEEVEESAASEVRRWAAARGIEAPESLPFTQPPPHVPADLSLPWPLAAAKALKRKPLEVAAELAEALGRVPGVETPQAAPPGFVNLRLTPEALVRVLDLILKDPAAYGADPRARKRSLLIEFVSANPTGPLHLASGRAATLGDGLARILRRLGHRVGTECYVNDAGRQVELLGLSVQARYDERRGRPAALPEGGYQGEYVREIAAQAPPEAEGWQAQDFRRFALERILARQKSDLEDFGVSFDRWFHESELHEGGAVAATLKRLRENGKAYDHEGAVWLASPGSIYAQNVPWQGISGIANIEDKDRVLMRSDGQPTYFLADIAYHKDKYERGWEELVDVWGADHHGYVPRMKAAVAALGRPPASFHAVIHQLVHLVRDQELVKMSKRAGEFVTLKELQAEAGRDACRFFFAQRTPNAHMNFDLELAKKRTQENPVYYVQYVHARISSIFKEAHAKGVSTAAALAGEPVPRPGPEARALLVQLARFPATLRACEQALSPHPLTNYLTDLAGLFHPFYERCRVVDPEDLQTTLSRLKLCDGVKAVIAEGLGLLGVSAPESM